ncbi:MAG TPA: hypothetical protein VKY15_09415 [Acidimicrobiales bacterium]|nr:hypothetical protein [Acidimicrobiales bacterium]
MGGVSRRRWARAALATGLLAALASTLAVLEPGGGPWRAGAAPFPGNGLFAYGDAHVYGSLTMPLDAPPVAVVPDGATGGYWLPAADGGIFAFSAPFFGSAGGIPLYAPVVGMAPTRDDAGYWMLGMDGGIFAFGDAPFLGSMGGHPLNAPVVGMAADPATGGYWLVASDGGIFSFGAPFYGSMGGRPLAAPVVAMATTPDGGGYWLVASDGGIFAFGDARFHGSMGGQPLNASVVGMARTADGGGYWLAGADGGVFSFGDAPYFGSHAGGVPTAPVSAIASTPDGGGYWLLDPDGFRYSMALPREVSFTWAGPAIASWAASQIGPNPDDSQGLYCNPYGPCEPWCALFATTAWEQAGVLIPHFAFVGDVYFWAAANGQLLSPLQLASPGDAVLYGTGPQTVDTAVHMGIVGEVWPDGAVVTVEGDAGPGPFGQHDVDLNGPFLPVDSNSVNGFPIFAVARP